MRPEDLIRLMDLENGPAPAVDPVSGPPAGAGVAPASPQAVQLDKWGIRRGADLMADTPELKELATKNNPTGTVAVADRWAKAVADFHGLAYETQPELTPRCEDALRRDFCEQLMQTPDFHEIRASTVMNTVAAEIATVAFAQQYGKRVAQQKADAAKGPKAGKKATTPGMDGEIRTMQAAAAACAAAKAAVDDFNAAADACGLGSGAAGNPLEAKRVAALYQRVKASPNLKRIAELAGRFRRVAQSKQRMKVAHGIDEVIGVTLHDELSRLLPAELALMTDDEYGLDTLRRWTDRQTMARETRASEPAGRGPIVVVVDESGSMQGTKVETAKALALSLAWIARKQNRWCCLVGFSGGTNGNFLVLKPGETKEQELCDWLVHFYGQGTDQDVPLKAVPAKWPEFEAAGMPKGKTDMIVVTDGIISVDAATEAAFNGWKAANRVKMVSLVVECRNAGGLVNVTDEINYVPALTPDGEAVGAVLSV